ncbi:glycosyltransferase [Marinobacter sp. 71-i]|uniref:Glycosyltransferase n=1 Tax=Marinobacter iranensis TaxID=2962607 RepID=A0ABT5Y5L1_9GAMM|nr:glycosyltransferase [Marinobacter iranensis]MDF0748956.1 glycosyltransferase [Marinobacter iranensis]
MSKRTDFDLAGFRNQPLPTESEIMKDWEGSSDETLVTVLCHTFNHAPYIEDALRGFLTQKTNFPFEVIVHDDASTDETPKIIDRFKKKYPHIIRPIFQVENQYSKGIKPTSLSAPRAKGNYIACCEGDDFWINNKKLQIQINLAKKNNDILLFFHQALLMKDNEIVRAINNYGCEPRVFDVSFPIKNGGGAMPTASLLIHRSIYDSLPSWIYDVPFGDYFIQAMASINGAYYFPEPHSVYRKQTPFSVSKKNSDIFGKDLEIFYNKSILALENLDDHFNKDYSGDILWYKSKVAQNCATQSLKFGDYNGFFKYINNSWSFKKFASNSQTVLRILQHTPRIARILISARNRVFKI